MKNARYICFEGTEGVGKTTQTQKLVDYLRAKGYKVFQTKEPGTPHSPLTMTLRGIMLDKQYDEQLTRQARELISQAIRSIHKEKVIAPALTQYDFIIQDRGILSGLSYGAACGNTINSINNLMNYIETDCDEYDDVVCLRGNIEEGLSKALSSKQEFAAGDAMEAKGVQFLKDVAVNMDHYSRAFNAHYIDVPGKDINQVFDEIISKLNVKDDDGKI